MRTFCHQFFLQRFAADDLNQDGKISGLEFVSLLQTFYPEDVDMPESMMPPINEIIEVFKNHDTNQNDYIDFHEFVRMILVEPIFAEAKRQMTSNLFLK